MPGTTIIRTRLLRLAREPRRELDLVLCNDAQRSWIEIVERDLPSCERVVRLVLRVSELPDVANALEAAAARLALRRSVA